MPFTAECFFCHVLIRNVPDHHRGLSKKCPRCKNSFTWAETSRPLSKAASSSEPHALHASNVHVTSKLATSGPSTFAIPEPPTHHSDPDLPALEPPPLETPAPPGRNIKVVEVPSPEDAPAPALRPRSPFRKARPAGYAGFFCFCFASCAFMTLSFSGALWISLPLALLALACGGVSLIASSTWSRNELAALPGLAVALGVLTMLAVAHRDVLARSKVRDNVSPASGPAALVHLHSAGVTQRIEPKEDAWVDASADAAQFGYVRVRVAGVTLESPGPPTPAARPTLLEKRLVIRLRVSNAGASQVVHYQGWNGNKAGLQLRDDQGRELRLKPTTRRGPGKFVAQADIPPEKWIDDDLVFEVPNSPRNALRLELPGSAVGRDDMLQFRIPGSMIQQRVGNTPAN